jgi:GTPase SAR1 family protein
MGNPSVGKTSIINSFMENSSMRGRNTERTKVIEDYTKILNVKDSKGESHTL